MKSFFKTILVVMVVVFSSFVSAKDSDIDVKPPFIVFPQTEIGSESANFAIRVENLGYAGGVDIGSISKVLTQSENFVIESDNCSSTSLVVDASCSLNVRFKPLSGGLKSALIDIPYGAGDDKLTVFLTNGEDSKHEVVRRLPPTVYELNVSEEMNATSTYELQWKLMGYHEGYEVAITMFDCNDTPAGECGSSYSKDEKFYESSYLTPVETVTGEWSYSGVDSQSFLYTHSFTVPTLREDGSSWAEAGTPIVIRFYVKSSEDDKADKNSLSLIIPGGLSDNYYDSSGRKVQKTICPDGGCNP